MSPSTAFILGVMFGTASLSAAVLVVSNRASPWPSAHADMNNRDLWQAFEKIEKALEALR